MPVDADRDATLRRMRLPPGVSVDRLLPSDGHLVLEMQATSPSAA